MSKKVGVGYSFKEKTLEKENEELKSEIKKIRKDNIELIKENEELKAIKEKIEAGVQEFEKKPKELTKAEIQAKLKEAGIEYAEKATKEELKALLPQE